MTEKITASVVVGYLERAIEGMKFLHEDQRDLVRGDVRTAHGKLNDKDFTAKDVRMSEGSRSAYERTVKGMEKALSKAKAIASAEAAILKNQSIPADAVRVVKVSSDLVPA